MPSTKAPLILVADPAVPMEAATKQYVDAHSFLTGTGAPTAGVGTDGAIYLDLTSLRFWGPKASGAWPGSAFGQLMTIPKKWQ